MDRGKGGIKHSVAVDAEGIPLGIICAPANRHDSPLLAETLDTVEARASLVHCQRGRACIWTAAMTRTLLASAWRNAL